MDHPAVKHLYNVSQEFYIGGKIQAVNKPEHYDYVASRCTLHYIRIQPPDANNASQLLPRSCASTSTSSAGPELSLSKPGTL